MRYIFRYIILIAKHIENYFCGRAPLLSIFSENFLAIREHNAWVCNKTANFSDVVLDYGCGSKPYQPKNFHGNWIGIDVLDGKSVDLVTKSGEIDLPDCCVCHIICTQVLEHVEELSFCVEELKRVMKPGATGIVTVPFLFPVHGEPYDFRRFTTYGIAKLFSDNGFEVIDEQKFGGLFGLVAAYPKTIFKNSNNRFIFSFYLITFPFWLLFQLPLNITCFLLNKLAGKDIYYQSCGIEIKNLNK